LTKQSPTTQTSSTPDEQPCSNESSSTKHEWMMAAWFLLGILVGVVGITVFNGLTARPGVDAAAVQQASRNGVLEALATLQARQRCADGCCAHARADQPEFVYGA
jgi:hypothetical protein